MGRRARSHAPLIPLRPPAAIAADAGSAAAFAGPARLDARPVLPDSPAVAESLPSGWRLLDGGRPLGEGWRDLDGLPLVEQRPAAAPPPLRSPWRDLFGEVVSEAVVDPVTLTSVNVKSYGALGLGWLTAKGRLTIRNGAYSLELYADPGNPKLFDQWTPVAGRVGMGIEFRGVRGPSASALVPWSTRTRGPIDRSQGRFRVRIEPPPPNVPRPLPDAKPVPQIGGAAGPVEQIGDWGQAEAYAVSVTVDDRPSIQEALDEAWGRAAHQYTEVRIPRGHYPLGVAGATTNQPLFVFSRTTLIGDGPETTLLSLARETNQPGPYPAAITITNSRSTTWARDNPARFYEPYAKGPNEGIRIEDLAVDGNRDGQTRLYAGGGVAAMWGDLRAGSATIRVPPDEAPATFGPEAAYLREFSGAYSARYGVRIDFTKSDFDAKRHRIEKPLHLWRVYLTLVDGGGRESTASVLSEIKRYTDDPDFRLTIAFAKVPNLNAAGPLRMKLYIRKADFDVGKEASKYPGYDAYWVTEAMNPSRPLDLIGRSEGYDPTTGAVIPLRIDGTLSPAGVGLLGPGGSGRVANPPGFGILSPGGNASASGVVLDNVRSCHLRDVVIRDCPVDGLTFSSSQSDPADPNGIDGGADDCTATRVRMERCGRWGACIPGRVRNVTFRECRYVDCNGGVDIEGHFLAAQSPRFTVDGVFFEDCHFYNMGGGGIYLVPSEAQVMRRIYVTRCRFAGQSTAILLGSNDPDYVIDDVRIRASHFYFTGLQAITVRARGVPGKVVKGQGVYVHPTGGEGSLEDCVFYHCRTAQLRAPFFSYATDNSLRPVLHFGSAEGTGEWMITRCTFTTGRWFVAVPSAANQRGSILACRGAVLILDANRFEARGLRSLKTAEPASELFVHATLVSSVLGVETTHLDPLRRNIDTLMFADDLEC